MKNIHILPTDKPSRLKSNKNVFDYSPAMMFIQEKDWKNQNIYITSDEKIKEGVNQWYLDKFLNKPRNSSGSQYGEKQDVIILTDNKDLIADGVQAIDDEFLEWFVKNPSCEEVEVAIMNKGYDSASDFPYQEFYKIIIPNEEPKITNCGNKNCQSGVINGKNPKLCKKCNPTEEPKQELERGITITHVGKQETLEEAAERLYPISKGGSMWMPSKDDCNKANKQEGFIEGAKWQAESMYSEGDMRLAINKARDISDGKDCFDAEDISGCTEVCTYNWKFNMSEDLIIEQLKKKS